MGIYLGEGDQEKLSQRKVIQLRSEGGELSKGKGFMEEEMICTKTPWLFVIMQDH